MYNRSMKNREKNFSYQEAIGRVVERLRIDKGLTQAQLAEAIGSSQSAIHRIEKGRQNHTKDGRLRLLFVLA